MRVWSVHPKYLDSKGLVALWRETLLAKNVLEGNTKGYRNHPQLNRFKACKFPLDGINYYLKIVYEEATARCYNFDESKFNKNAKPLKIKVTRGQVDYEFQHLLNKLKLRDKRLYDKWKHLKTIETHSLFSIVEGEVEDWEIVIEKTGSKKGV